MTMRRSSIISSIAVLGAVLGALLGVAVVLAAPDPRRSADAEWSAWSPVMYPLQRIPLVFSHRVHLARGATCGTCHPAATTSRSAVDNLIPTEAACRACHPIDRAEPERVVAGAPAAACRACHPGWRPDLPVQRVYLTPPPLKFAHSAHASTPCVRCHGDMTTVDLATTRQLPTMASCLACHTEGADPGRCSDCHLTRPGGLLQTRFSHGDLVPRQSGLGDAHGPGFSTRHSQEARQIGATCETCHDRSECVACHQGVTKPLEFHPSNYLLAHGVEARRGKPDCSACHRAQTFCVGCHERTGVGMGPASGFAPQSAFHPAGWASPGPSANRHASEARRNIASCASCHRESDCIPCHSAGPLKLGVSPHPAGWRGSARCRALDRQNRRMCLRCHVALDELGCDWVAP